MCEGATQPWITNMTAVEKYATVDAVTGATFVNTNEYLGAILDAAKAAK